jgi:hypothetical protein
MKWMVDNNKVFVKNNDVWFLAWIELDKTEKGEINKENFGIRIRYCNFCGKKIGQN